MRLTAIWKLVKEIAELEKIPPEWIMAVILTESSGDPAADSGYARGLMQISEIVLRDINKRFDLNLKFSNMYDPEKNILVGTKYLKWLVAYWARKLKIQGIPLGSFLETYVTMSWNWGVGNTREWLNLPGDNSIIDESVPSETKAHVVDVPKHFASLRMNPERYLLEIEERR